MFLSWHHVQDKPRAVDRAEDAEAELGEVEHLYTGHGMWNSAFG